MAQGARQYHTQQIHFLRKGITFADDTDTITVGYIPVGSVILKPLSGVAVTTVFNGGGPQLLDIGPPDNTDFWATDLALSVATFVPCDENVSFLSTTTEVQAVLACSGATAGAAEIIIAYVPDIDA